MFNKIAFLCTDPWENFLPVAAQSHGREYFQWIRRIAKIQNPSVCSRELIEVYGEYSRFQEFPLFCENESNLQLVYVQSRSEPLVKKVFKKSDLVLMGLPGCRKTFETMFLSVVSWREKILFLWDRQCCSQDTFLKQLCNEYKLRESQLMEVSIMKKQLLS